MADAIVPVGTVGRVRLFLGEVVAEMRRVTWPDKGQIWELSRGVVILALLVGAVIGILDVILQNVLVKWLPSLFGG